MSGVQQIKVSLKKDSYPIFIGRSILSQAGNILKQKEFGLSSHAVVVSTSRIWRLHGKTLLKSLSKAGITAKVLTVGDSEKSKSIKVAISLIGKIAHYDIKKKIFIIAFGGGVVGDLAGFVAAIYKRGIPCIQVPTTFLAQIDSSIGGKVAVDTPQGKNLIGAFYQPKCVLSDIVLLKTLPPRQFRNGLAEAVKYGVIRDARLFHYLEENITAHGKVKESALPEIITACSRIKANVVSLDEKETKGIRTILNFGHTIGHAIEAASQYRLQHGEAVGLGMRMAGCISYQLGLTSYRNCLRMEALLDKAGLPNKVKGIKIESILGHMQYDKKNIEGKNRFVLMEKIGKVIVKEDIPMPIIKEAIKAYL